MTTPTLSEIRGWRPEGLQAVADDLDKTITALDDQVNGVRTAMNRATAEWRGEAADAASARADREVSDGLAVVEALRTARHALATGAIEIGAARSALLVAVDTAHTSGLRVAEDGVVSAPRLPPVMTTPENAAAADAEREAQQSALACRVEPASRSVGEAFEAVVAADQRTAAALRRIEVPESMRAQIDALMAPDERGGLFGWALGGAAVLRGGIMARTTFVKFLAAFGRVPSAELFHYGPANGGLLRFLIGTRAARVVGRAFLPLTVLSGGIDVMTGGGYDGARGWATRGFGAAGAAGAGALMIMGPAALASNPVGWGIAAGAVTAYGAWSAGNFIYDHRESIGNFFSQSAAWTGDVASAGWNATTEAVSDARDWAGDRLSDAADLGRSVLSRVRVPDLNPF